MADLGEHPARQKPADTAPHHDRSFRHAQSVATPRLHVLSGTTQAAGGAEIHVAERM
jgi:hypothetical protein